MSAPDWLTARPVAHRGYHDRGAGRIENTLAAASAAVARGFSIEVDLQTTADERVVVFHDDTLDRLTEASGPVERATLQQLKTARFRVGDQRIPTLEELLDLVDGRVPLVIELKGRWNSDRRLEQAVTARLAEYAGPVALMSFDPASVAAVRRLAPHLPRGMIADRFPRDDWPQLSGPRRMALRWLLAATRVLPNFIAYGVKALPASAPLALRHFFRVPLLTWTVRTAADRATARQWADQIIFEAFDPEAD